MNTRAKILADWRLLGDEKFGDKYDDNGEYATGLINARLMYANEEYTILYDVSFAACVIFEYKFHHEADCPYSIHYIWND